MTSMHDDKAILALEDGSVFHGTHIGAAHTRCGEVVFNTAMTGYQEILSDPSYARQMVTLTYPHIGNTGCNDNDQESSGSLAAGLIIRDLSMCHSNWRAQQSLSAYLLQQGITGIAGLDTRELTRRLREHGSLRGCIMTGSLNEADAIAQARACESLEGADLAIEAGCRSAYEWTEGSIDLLTGKASHCETPEFHVVAVDYGCKRNILRLLVDQGCRVTVVPPDTDADAIMAYRPDGVFLSNGPGDPAACDYAIAAIGHLLEAKRPLFGICLGAQLLGLATGGRTWKMKFGHHGANHPVQDLATGKVMITSQNHGFAIDEDSLPEQVQVSHRSLFDQSVQGIRLTDRPAFGFQGHPEASPGPHDIQSLFEDFAAMMRES